MWIGVCLSRDVLAGKEVLPAIDGTIHSRRLALKPPLCRSSISPHKGPHALQPVVITPTSVGAGFIPLVEQAKPFLMLPEGTEVRPVIKAAKATHVPLVVAWSVR